MLAEASGNTIFNVLFRCFSWLFQLFFVLLRSKTILTMDDRHYLMGLISEGEHQQQDFKYRVEDAVKLARSVSAFANTVGGRLLIGVRDDGALCGVRSEEEIYVMHQAAYRYCRPEASIKFDTYHVAPNMPMERRGLHAASVTAAERKGLRTIVVATVPPSERKPVYALEPPEEEGGEERRRAYIRIADENIVASPVHLAIWREEQSLRGTSFTYGTAERQLMGSMGEGEWLRLNQIVRRSQLPRPRVITLLARLMRYGLVDCRFDNHQFCFALTP